MMLSCRGGLHESPMLVSDLASALKFMGWPGTVGEGRGGEMGNRRGEVPSWGAQRARGPQSPRKLSNCREGEAARSRMFSTVLLFAPGTHRNSPMLSASPKLNDRETAGVMSQNTESPSCVSSSSTILTLSPFTLSSCCAFSALRF